jgi:membrane fusion protein, copper/silver efflux system
MSDEAIALANIQTTVVGTGNTDKAIQLYGSIQPDARFSQTQSSYVSGRIERLLVNFVGESVRQGQSIATIYSPELLNAQQELIEAAKLVASQPYLLLAARQKLRYLNMTEDQIRRIEKSGKVPPVLDVKSNTNGILVEKNVSQGDYVNQGTVMFKVANLSQIWAMFDAYESDLPFLKVGEHLTFTLKALPGKTFSGKISFIDPIVDKTTRTAKIRIVIPNPGLLLKPEMYATATVNSSLTQYQDRIVIPKSAILWTGKRSIVYVKQQGISSPVFSLREVELGPSLGKAFVILSGLKQGEEIVTNGVFSVDASAQLEGKPSMMNKD